MLGLDCCEAFLEKGRRDAASAGLRHVEFVASDVERYAFEPTFDLCFSRFGMMFFASPVVALRNVRSALKPGGRLIFIVWRNIDDNPWLGVPKELVLHYLPPPGEGAQTCGPGPFSMAHPEVVQAQLGAARFEDVAFERVDGPVMVGHSPEEAMQFQLHARTCGRGLPGSRRGCRGTPQRDRSGPPYQARALPDGQRRDRNAIELLVHHCASARSRLIGPATATPA